MAKHNGTKNKSELTRRALRELHHRVFELNMDIPTLNKLIHSFREDIELMFEASHLLASLILRFKNS